MVGGFDVVCEEKAMLCKVQYTIRHESPVRILVQLSASARSDSFGGGNEPGSRLPPHPHAYILFSLFIYSDCRWSRATLRIPMARLP